MNPWCITGSINFMVQQLTLSVALRDDARFANFYVGQNSQNQQIVHALKQQWEPQGELLVYLCGVSGVGVSHLLQAACHYAEGLGYQSIYLPLDEMAEYGPAVLEGIEQLSLVALDNLQTVAGKPEWEQALFHLFNRVRDGGNRLLVGADAPATQIPVALPDLQSRLSWGATFVLQALNDEEKLAALQWRAKHRGLNLSEEVGRYILTRGPRDMSGVFSLLDTLDQASLAQQRKLTIPFIKPFV